ncbi:hypothetical protein [Streptomyces melanogenes]|uniref:hypothetical protein n=1 Tax=Streptomyces melanogenes TaxID=67326 RepID=UPI0037BABFFE
MDVPTLVLLGAAGGLLRELLDVYTRFMDWQADRRAHRQLSAGQEGKPPQFLEYFDPVADPIAAVVHSLLGAGAAVLFGTTGQINGAYAALIVGMSAPLLLTQLGRIQSVSETVIGAQAPDVSEAQGVVRAAPTAREPEAARAGDDMPPREAADGTPLPSVAASFAVADTETVASTPPPVTVEAPPSARLASPAEQTGQGRGGHGAQQLQRRPHIGEEGRP